MVDLAFFYGLVTILNGLRDICDFVTNPILGFSLKSGRISHRTAAEADNLTAHVMTATMRGNFSILLPMHSDRHFTCLHHEYADPADVILGRNNVTLMTVCADKAVFCETDPNVDVTDTKEYPFMFVGQFAKARRLVVVPVDAFHTLAETAMDSNVSVTVVHMTTRCGSTLLAQAANMIPGVRSLSEPMALVNLHEMYARGEIGLDECRKLLQSGMKLLCKVEEGSGVRHIFVKLPVACAPQVKMLAEHFPNVNFIFATRHPEATLTSLYRVMQREFSTIFHRTRLGWLHTRLVYPFPYDQYEHIKNRLRSSSVHWRRCLSGREQFLALSTAASLACFLQPSSSNVYCKVMLYEDLLAHPEREMLSLLHTMGVSPDYLHLAQTAMSFDSQAKAFGADENNSPDTAAAVTLNQEAWRYVDEIYEEMNLSVHRTMTLDEYREVLAGQTLRSGTWKA